jgi:hypothetical protein
VSVECCDGVPATIVLGRGRLAVADVIDEWLVEDEWWRHPISRHYRCLILDDGRLLTVFEDRETGAWFRQHYAVRDD